jgi:hypothetical protein
MKAATINHKHSTKSEQHKDIYKDNVNQNASEEEIQNVPEGKVNILIEL